MFVNIFYKSTMEHANFGMKCPYLAGHYTITNFAVNIPSVVPFPSNTSICILNKFHAKASGEKKFEVLGTVRISFSHRSDEKKN